MHCLCSLAGCDDYGTTSVGNEDYPQELNLRREKTKEEKLGIVFKTVNQVRLVVEIVVHRRNFAEFSRSTNLFVTRVPL